MQASLLASGSILGMVPTLLTLAGATGTSWDLQYSLPGRFSKTLKQSPKEMAGRRVGPERPGAGVTH